MRGMGKPAGIWGEARKLASQYRREEDGSLVAFSLFIFIAMLMFGGIAVDLMVYENKRTHIQNSTDSAVLAAANLNQTVDPKVVVQDYLAKVGITVTPEDISVTEVGTAPVITGRQVSVAVGGQYDTMLMNLVGVDHLGYGSMSQAEESISDVEISLVLDVSGSMNSNSKLQNMQTAAKDFLDKVLAGADDDRVSLSLVPYATQVSAGQHLMTALTTQGDHNYSYCVDFTKPQFSRTDIDHANPLQRTAHFDPWRNYRYGMSLRYPVCRTESYFHITPWSNNLQALKDQVDALEAQGNTSIDVAMKWGAALLDPSMNPQMNAMIANPSVEVDPAFSVRPHAYTNDDTLKFIVVMTDGINTKQPYLIPPYDSGNSPYYREIATGDIWIEYEEPGNRDGDSRWNEDWYNVTDKYWNNAPNQVGDFGGAYVQMGWLDVWASMNMSWRAYAEYHQSYDADDYYDALYDPREWIPAQSNDPNDDTKDKRLATICQAAKDNGIIVFAVGFEVTDASAAVMRNCASTPQHFYRVEGLDIEYAFASIANQINQLKLTQ